MRTIMLIDMDAFYVACEELRHPEIRDVPAVVGWDPKEGSGRGVVMTCNYRAREFGIRSGMPISMAYKLNPKATYLKPDFDYYDDVSRKVMSAIRPLVDKLEQVSIDEAFADVEKRVDSGDPVKYANEIRKAVLDGVGLKCSIGIGPNKLIAKMACEKAKPNGVKLIRQEEVKEFLKGRKIDELYGVGKKTAEKLEKMGYRTTDELAKANAAKLVGELGSFGGELVKYANGIDESEVTENYEIKSIGREFTFEKDTDKEQEIEDGIRKLGMDVIAEARKNQVHFKVVTLKLRYSNFVEHLHSKSIRMTDDPGILTATAIELYKNNVDRLSKVRKLGVRISNFVSYRGQMKIA